MKILAFAASNSTKSINKALVSLSSQLLEEHTVEILDINDYEVPMFSQDLEAEQGAPRAAEQFLAKIANADALLISYAEHNYNFVAAYKNLFDWASRINRQVYQGKPTIMMATSIGPGGGKNVLRIAVDTAKYFDGNVIGTFLLPSFNDNFDRDSQSITNAELLSELKTTLALYSDVVVAS